MEPRAASIRVLSALGYLPPVAIALLLMPGYRSIRHVRLHAMKSLALMAFFVGGAVLISWAGAILGSMTGGGFLVLSVSGLAISLWMLLMLGFSLHGAIAAYQGRATRLPWIERALRNLDRMAEHPLSRPTAPPKRRGKQPNRS